MNCANSDKRCKMTSEQKKKQFAKSKTTLFHEPNVSRAYFPLAHGRQSSTCSYYPSLRRDLSDDRVVCRPRKPNPLMQQNFIVSKRNARLALASDGFSRSFDDAWQDHSRNTTAIDDDFNRLTLTNRDAERNRIESCSAAEDLNVTPQHKKRTKKLNKLFSFNKLFSSKSTSLEDQLTPDEPPSPVSSNRVKSSKSVTFSDHDDFTDKECVE